MQIIETSEDTVKNSIFETGKFLDLKKVSKIALYTGTNGKEGCTCKCMGCYFGGIESEKYQGNIDQINELQEALPSLVSGLIFGNPDISVDTEFCNEVAHNFQKRKRDVAFNTSGIGGVKTLQKLLKGIDPRKVRFVDFSLDSIDNEKLAVLKNPNYTLEKVIDGIKYCNELGIPTGVKPTIWTLNMNDNWRAYEEFCRKQGVSRFTFHFGSVENITDNRMKHISEDNVMTIKNKYRNIGRMPQPLLTDEEFAEYSKNYKPRCWSGKGPLVLSLERDGIKASAVCNVLTAIHPELIVDLKDGKVPLLKKKSLECPVGEKAFGFKSEKYHSVCRYYLYDAEIKEFRNDK